MTSSTVAVNVTPLFAGSCVGPSNASLSNTRVHVHNLERISHNGSSKKRRRLGSPGCLTESSKHQHESDIQWMLSQLSALELETAARASYLYLKETQDSKQTLEQQEECATALAARYLFSKKGNRDLALSKLKATLRFRQYMDLDGLRLAFHPQTNRRSSSSASSMSPSSTLSAKDYEMLEKCLSSGKNYVMCHDKKGRSTHIFVPRNTQHHDKEWTIKESLYTMERALATSKADDGSFNAVLDFRGFSTRKHTPPFKLGKEFVLTMRKHYAGSLHRIFILDAPMSFTWLYKAVQPFLGKKTRDKIVFCNGEFQKQKILSQHYTEDQAAQWMLPLSNKTGKNRDFDVQEYLYESPFEKAFDE